MSTNYPFGPLKQSFAIGDRVVVSAKCAGWRCDAPGVICGAPEPVQTVQGEDYFYWVQFDTPQHDLSEDGPYRKAQILGRCLFIEAQMKLPSSPLPSEEQPESYEPTAEEIALMREATPTEAEAVDAMILRECSGRFRKVAMVAGRLFHEFESAYPHLPFAYIQARMQKLEDAGVLEIAGDVWAMRFSEIRLTAPRDEA